MATRIDGSIGVAQQPHIQAASARNECCEKVAIVALTILASLATFVFLPPELAAMLSIVFLIGALCPCIANLGTADRVNRVVVVQPRAVASPIVIRTNWSPTPFLSAGSNRSLVPRVPAFREHEEVDQRPLGGLRLATPVRVRVVTTTPVWSPSGAKLPSREREEVDNRPRDV